MKIVDTSGWWVSCLACKMHAEYARRESFCLCSYPTAHEAWRKLGHFVTKSEVNAKLAAAGRIEDITP